jgi:hypothetical protein
MTDDELLEPFAGIERTARQLIQSAGGSPSRLKDVKRYVVAAQGVLEKILEDDDDLVLASNEISIEGECLPMYQHQQTETVKDRLNRLRDETVRDVVVMSGLSERNAKALLLSVENARGLKSRQKIVSTALGLNYYLRVPGEQPSPEPLGSAPSQGGVEGNFYSGPFQVDQNNIPLSYKRLFEHPGGAYEIVPTREILDVRVFEYLNLYLSERSGILMKQRETQEQIEIARRRLERLQAAA